MRTLNAEELEIAQSAQSFVAEHIIPRAAEFDKSGEFHTYLLEKAKPTRIFAMAVPKAYGGLGYSAMAQSLVLEAWGYGCAAMGTTLAASSLSLGAVLIAGNDEQKRRFCAPLADGKIGAFALTEPDAGSDVGSGKTTASRTEAGYLLNGSKCWITNASIADVHVTFARSGATDGSKGLSAFIMDKNQPGFILGDIEHKLGLRSSNTAFYRLKDAPIPAENLLGQEGDGMKIAMATLDVGRTGIAALAVGVAQRALDECVRFLQNRFPAHHYPGQSLQFKLADMQIQIEAARQALYHVADLRDANEAFSKEAAISKTLCTDTAMSITSRALTLMGSYGYSSEMAKLMRDAKVMQIYEGTNQVQRIVISRSVLAARPSPSATQQAGA